MFARWRQENYFRYGRQRFALDALDSYACAPDEPTPEGHSSSISYSAPLPEMVPTYPPPSSFSDARGTEVRPLRSVDEEVLRSTRGGTFRLRHTIPPGTHQATALSPSVDCQLQSPKRYRPGSLSQGIRAAPSEVRTSPTSGTSRPDVNPGRRRIGRLAAGRFACSGSGGGQLEGELRSRVCQSTLSCTFIGGTR